MAEATDTMRVISLGWGIQSFGLAAMSALDVLPRVDVAIHADTTHERVGTYDFARRWTPWLEEHGVRVVTVQPFSMTEIADISPSGHSRVQIPVLTLLRDGTSTKGGQLVRQCTGNWKIRPIRRWLQANRHGKLVDMWLGISADEIGRVALSKVGYIVNRWPLIESERPMRRADVVNWLIAHNIEVPPRSACYFCPFQGIHSWRKVRESADWDRAVVVDEAIRGKRPPYDLFLHSSRIPLRQVDFRSEQEKGQMELWDGFDNECSGTCGV